MILCPSNPLSILSRPQLVALRSESCADAPPFRGATTSHGQPLPTTPPLDNVFSSLSSNSQYYDHHPCGQNPAKGCHGFRVCTHLDCFVSSPLVLLLEQLLMPPPEGPESSLIFLLSVIDRGVLFDDLHHAIRRNPFHVAPSHTTFSHCPSARDKSSCQCVQQGSNLHPTGTVSSLCLLSESRSAVGTRVSCPLWSRRAVSCVPHTWDVSYPEEQPY